MKRVSGMVCKKVSIILINLVLVSLIAFAAACASARYTSTDVIESSLSQAGTQRTQTYSGPKTLTVTQAAPTTYAIRGGSGSTPYTTFTLPAPTTMTAPYPSYSANDNLGLATGGAKDVNNFRENIDNNYLPLPTDITYEGLFYDYYFETGQPGQANNKLFSPAYAYAVTRDPLSHQTEYYLSIGLNSGLKESDFQRKKLNLVIVMDISGSMGEEFNRYYYDNTGNLRDIYADEGISRARKIDSARQAAVDILDQLHTSDRFAIVQFNSNASTLVSMGLVGETDMNSVRNRVFNIIAGGSTNLEAGLNAALRQFKGMYELNNYEYENRIIVLTDAEPNTGDYSTTGLWNIVRDNAASRIYTTFIGVGVDFNTRLIDQITKIKGANYYSIHSPGDFRERIQQEFDYMVTPLVFDLTLNFISNGWRIEKVYGSPEADEATGELMRINTMFPSPTVEGKSKGGIVILKLQKTSAKPDSSVNLKVKYEDCNGNVDSSQSVIALESARPEYFDNPAIRKGILLARYANLMKNWTTDERQHLIYSHPWPPCINEDTGIIVWPDTGLTEQERQSLPLVVSDPYKEIFKSFGQYFNAEMKAVGDYTLDQELAILERLTN